MSVLVDRTARRRIWRGYDDPGLPTGMWYGWVSAVGDGTGGDVILDLLLENAEASPGTPGLTGNHYNIEAISAQSTLSSATVAAMELINLTPPVEGAALFTRTFSLPMALNELNDNAILIGDLLPRPLFIGSRQLPAVSCIIRFTQDNNSGETIIFYAEGYVWGARSLQAEGGLRRPVGSLYG